MIYSPCKYLRQVSTCASPDMAALAEGRSFHSTVGCGGTETGYPINDRAVSVANYKVHNDFAVDQNQEASTIGNSYVIITVTRIRSTDQLRCHLQRISCDSRRQRYRRLAVDAAHGAPAVFQPFLDLVLTLTFRVKCSRVPRLK